MTKNSVRGGFDIENEVKAGIGVHIYGRDETGSGVRQIIKLRR